MESEFSSDGAYYAVLSTDGKLKIWETSTSILKHEYTPSLQLNQPCTCMKWIQLSSKQSPWRKRKRSESSESNPSQCLALGTKSGSILIYSPFEVKVLQTLVSNENTSTTIDCLSWAKHSGLISCLGYFIIRWNIADGTIKSKWKNDKNELIRCALVLDSRPHLLTATRMIKLWNFETKELLHTFTGHASDVLFLIKVPASEDGNINYFISGAKTDRFLNCWSLNGTSETDKSAVAKFVMEDIASFVSIILSEDGSITMAVTSRSGVVHVYKQTLNGKCIKPLKPKVTLQVAADNENNKEITSIPILTSYMCEDCSVLIGYGANHIIVFEKITISTFEKLQCLIRTDPRKLKSQTNDATKTKTPESRYHVEYLTPSNLVSTPSSTKRKHDSEKNDSYEVPMEKRLENLLLSKPDAVGVVPKSDNVANLLIQGLHSKDKNILLTVFKNSNETIVRNTVKRLPIQILTALVKELTSLIQGKTIWSKSGTVWLKQLVYLHASQLLANPELNDLLNPALGFIKNRSTLLPTLSQLRGRLDLLVSQVSTSTADDFAQEPITYEDSDTDDSSSDDNIDMNEQFESEDQWDENEMDDEDSSNEVEAEDKENNDSNDDDNNNSASSSEDESMT